MSVYQEAYHLPEFTYDKYEKLTIEQRGPVYICSFNDPGNLNAMSYEQMAEFNDFLNLVRYDKDCRVIVLTGEGKSFCAGFNLNDLFLDPPEDMGRIQRDFYVMQRMCSDQVLNMAKCEQPIIGALKGFAVGGGLSIATACDMRILGESFKMNAGYLSIGYTGTDMSGSFYLPKRKLWKKQSSWLRKSAARLLRSVCVLPRKHSRARSTVSHLPTRSRWRTATRFSLQTPRTLTGACRR